MKRTIKNSVKSKIRKWGKTKRMLKEIKIKEDREKERSTESKRKEKDKKENFVITEFPYPQNNKNSS